MATYWQNRKCSFRRCSEPRRVMPRRLVDISSPLQAGIKSDPPHMLPQIEYLDHHQTAPAMAEYMGVKVDQLPTANMPLWKKCRSALITALIWTRHTIFSLP